jgi:hypothetical protein
MVIAPILLNSLFCYLIDTIIMRKRPYTVASHDPTRRPLLDDERP